jgi:chromosome segregation ATPase
MTQRHETELRGVEDELQNARALIEKLQGLNASLQHQVTALHTEIARADEHAKDLLAQLAQQADPAPDLETVELKDLIDAVRCFLADGQEIVIRAKSDSVSIQALNGAQFVCSSADAMGVLDHAAALDPHLVVF